MNVKYLHAIKELLSPPVFNGINVVPVFCFSV
jgi:hypothetical protein